MSIRNPGTGEEIDKVPKATLQDVERAVNAAQRGKEAMRQLTALQRYEILTRIAKRSTSGWRSWAGCWLRRMANPSRKPGLRWL